MVMEKTSFNFLRWQPAHLSDYYAHRVYRITHPERPLTLQIKGDAWKAR